MHHSNNESRAWESWNASEGPCQILDHEGVCCGLPAEFYFLWTVLHFPAHPRFLCRQFLLPLNVFLPSLLVPHLPTSSGPSPSYIFCVLVPRLPTSSMSSSPSASPLPPLPLLPFLQNILAPAIALVQGGGRGKVVKRWGSFDVKVGVGFIIEGCTSNLDPLSGRFNLNKQSSAKIRLHPIPLACWHESRRAVTLADRMPGPGNSARNLTNQGQVTRLAKLEAACCRWAQLLGPPTGGGWPPGSPAAGPSPDSVTVTSDGPVRTDRYGPGLRIQSLSGNHGNLN
eukprot:768797-Hanusia_phi.AAC.6